MPEKAAFFRLEGALSPVPTMASAAWLAGHNPRLRSRVARLIPPEVTLVAESAIRSPEDVRRMGELGAHAVLVGEGSQVAVGVADGSTTGVAVGVGVAVSNAVAVGEAVGRATVMRAGMDS